MRAKILLGSLATVIACLFSTTSLAAVEAGKILMASGDVQVKDSSLAARKVQRRDPINVGDTIITGKQSQVQVKMKDGATIALGADAEFHIGSYTFNEPGQKDKAVMTLLKGGLRTITGKIDKSGYEMKTPVSTLGIRGTVYDIYVGPDGTTTVIIRDGGVGVTGADGTKTIVLDVDGLASIIKPGQAAGEPGPVPPEVLEYLRGILPFPPDNVTWKENEDGTIEIDIGGDNDDPSDDIVLNIINTIPPTTNGNGFPDEPHEVIPTDPCAGSPFCCGRQCGY